MLGIPVIWIMVMEFFDCKARYVYMRDYSLDYSPTLSSVAYCSRNDNDYCEKVL